MNYRYWLVGYSADTTETGSTFNRAYIRTQWMGYASQDYCAEEMLRDFCREQFGREVEYVMGYSPCLNWHIHKSTHEQWVKAERQLWGGTPTTSLRMTVGMERGGKFKILQKDKNPTTPPDPTYDDLVRENAELRQQLVR